MDKVWDRQYSIQLSSVPECSISLCSTVKLTFGQLVQEHKTDTAICAHFRHIRDWKFLKCMQCAVSDSESDWQNKFCSPGD